MTLSSVISQFRRSARAIREAPGLRGLKPIWLLLRAPYKWILSLSSQGVEVTLARSVRVVMPPRFCAGNWEDYEIQEVQRVARWLDENPRGLVLDVGCSVGIYCLIALSRSSESEVIGFDPDLSSLKATQNICTFVDKKRLHVIHGFVSNRQENPKSAEEAIQSTGAALSRSSLTGELGTTEYRFLENESDRSIPVYALDKLWTNGYPDRPILVKSDVEGAEQLVLEGAKALLNRRNTTLALSIHPPALPTHGHSPATVRRLLEDAGYQIEILAIDHEEHWWCERKK